MDGNLGGAAAIAEILLQSHWHSLPVNARSTASSDWLLRAWPSLIMGGGGGSSSSSSSASASIARATTLIELDLLPALPAKLWPSGRVKGLQARGGLEVVSLAWQSKVNRAEKATTESNKQLNSNPQKHHGAGSAAEEKPTEELLLAAGAAEGTGAAALVSLRAKVRRPYWSSSRANNNSGTGSSRANSDVQAERAALALACSAEVRVRSFIPLEVVSWSLALLPTPSGLNNNATLTAAAAAAGGAGAAARTSAAEIYLHHATEYVHQQWDARMTKGHAAKQWRSVREMRGAAAADGGEPALFFGAPYVLDLPPLPPGAALSLRSIS